MLTIANRGSDVPMIVNPQDLWQSALGELRRQMTRSTFDTWLKSTQGLTVDDNRLVVAVPTTYARDWLDKRLRNEVDTAVTEVAGVPMTCAFVVRSMAPGERTGGTRAPARSAADQPEYAQPGLPAAGAAVVVPAVPLLNARYTFDTFVVGGGNRLAHAAAQAVAEHVATRYNPLFIYGGVGLGKTHLLHAIGHGTVARGLKVVLVSSEKFTNDLVNAIRTHGTDEFRAVYRAADVLLIDDIHFIAGKESTQEEFFHTFNALHGADRQIVLTSDRPPHAIATLEDRLRSRFQWGLQVDVAPPDLETRMAILRAKADRHGQALSDGVIELIANTVQHNIRELEGALNRVLAYAQCHHLAVTVEVARRALAELMLRREPPSTATVLRVVAEYYGLSQEELLSRNRANKVSEPRQVAMYLLREETDASFPAIGEALGGRDHTTVLHGYEKIARLMDQDAKLRRDIIQMRERLYAG
jgi:chromosomal replication initiator protein